MKASSARFVSVDEVFLFVFRLLIGRWQKVPAGPT
jgi:hypothetical protein